MDEYTETKEQRLGRYARTLGNLADELAVVHVPRHLVQALRVVRSGLARLAGIPGWPEPETTAYAAKHAPEDAEFIQGVRRG